ncbi:hypothetical protein DITRI_Ditri11bG0002400 [Diplodiscus trichospermus]
MQFLIHHRLSCGNYISKDYNVPNITKLHDTAVFMATHVEEMYRKAKNKYDNYLLLLLRNQ